MRIRLLVAAAKIAFMFLLLVRITAQAPDVKVLSGGGFREVMADLGSKFERATGHKLAITFGSAGAVVKRVQDGETADVVILAQQGIDRLVKEGRAAAGDVTVVARASTGVAVRKGAHKPDISSPEALKSALLAAKSITYSDPVGGSTSGIHFVKVLDRLGIANEMKSKTILPSRGGASGDLVANGEAEIVVDLFPLLIAVPGIELIGPLPGDLQDIIVVAAVVVAGAKETEASKALINFLRTPEAVAVIKARGMEPATP
jgi:molybdate transport system substrate-binding protein